MTPSEKWRDLDPATIVLHAGRGADTPGAPTNVPPVLASIYKPGVDLLYGRNGNPTWAAFEEVLGALEGGSALAFASGMAASNAIFDLLPLGAKVVAPANAYYNTVLSLRDRADKGFLELITVDITGAGATEATLEGATLLWLESPSNPLIGISDIVRLSRAAHSQGALVVVDSTFATPLLQTPLSLGADLVVHSATKFISGHSDVVMGAVVTADDEMAEKLLRRRTSGGAIPGPLEAYLALRGLRSLPVRLERAQANAAAIAERLEAHPRVERVLYPGLASHPGHELAATQMRGFGAMLSFQVTGGATGADQVCDSTRLILNATSLGAIETTMERRARWGNETSAPENLIRMSVGCEALNDLWADLAQALG